MKKFAALLLTFVMAVSLAACAGNSEPAETSTPDAESSISAESTTPESSEAVSEPESELATDSQTEETESPADTDTESIGTNVLVAYFSATGTTEGVAENIAGGLDADLYEIVPEEPYTDADLDYHDDNSRSTIEMNDPSSRPAISGSVENMEQYSIVFIGYPIWWEKLRESSAPLWKTMIFPARRLFPSAPPRAAASAPAFPIWRN